MMDGKRLKLEELKRLQKVVGVMGESRYGIRKNKRNAVTEGNAVFILDRQRAVDPGSAEKEAEFQYRLGSV